MLKCSWIISYDNIMRYIDNILLLKDSKGGFHTYQI